MTAPLVIASNRGPVSFTRNGSGFETSRGVGGLVTAVTSAVKDEDAIWVAAALSDDDRARAAEPEPILGEPSAGIEVRLIDLDPDLLAGYYEEASNRSIWFVAHGQPSPDVSDHAWNDYRRANEIFARNIAAAASEGATVLVQDYHLCLVPKLLKQQRPDLRIAFFWHIPFPQPDGWRQLGDDLALELLDGINHADVAGFHAQRWTSRLEASREQFGLPARAHIAKLPLGVAPEGILALAESPDAKDRARDLDVFEDQILIVRSDRIDPAKGVPDGIDAFAALIERREDLREKVSHLIRLTPSRGGIPEYDAERARIEASVQAVNDRFASPSWTPITLVVQDDLPGSLAAYRRYDVLLVSSLADGMNLVAREGPLVNRNDGVLVLSAGAGAADAYRDGGALLVEPGDVEGISAALERAVTMPAEERARFAQHAREVAPGTPPARWLSEQRRLANEMFSR